MSKLPTKYSPQSQADNQKWSYIWWAREISPQPGGGAVSPQGIVEEEERQQLCFRRTNSASGGSGATLEWWPRKWPRTLLRETSDDSAEWRGRGPVGFVVMLESQNVRARHSLEVSHPPLSLPVRAGPRTGRDIGGFPKSHTEIRTDPHNPPSQDRPVTTLGWDELRRWLITMYSSATTVSVIKPRCHILFLLSQRVGRLPVSRQIETDALMDQALDTRSCEGLPRKCSVPGFLIVE